MKNWYVFVSSAKEWLDFPGCEELVLNFHNCEESVPVLHTCEELREHIVQGAYCGSTSVVFLTRPCYSDKKVSPILTWKNWLRHLAVIF